MKGLADRRGDILPLARRALQGCARGGQMSLRFTADAERTLLHHEWPGNARELTNIVQRAAWLASGGQIKSQDLDIVSLAAAGTSGTPAIPAAAAADAPAQ